MSYYDSAEGIKITRKRAERECKDHGIPLTDPDWQEFAAEQSWPIQAQLLLDWLGY